MSAPTACTGAGTPRDAAPALAVSALDVIAYTDGVVRLDARVSSGTYVRAIADALGGHCRSLRRTKVGPFSVEDADEERIVPPAKMLAGCPRSRSRRTMRRPSGPAGSTRSRTPGRSLTVSSSPSAGW